MRTEIVEKVGVFPVGVKQITKVGQVVNKTFVKMMVERGYEIKKK